MPKTKHGNAKILAFAATSAIFIFLISACSSGPKVINIGNSGSRVNVQTVD